MTTAPARPLPVPISLSQPFWDAVRDHRLTVQRCRTCGRWEWTPTEFCGYCHTETLEWTPVSGNGTVYAYSVVSRPQTPGFTAPYVVAIVRLDEGVRMLSTLVDVDPDDVRIGMDVVVTFEDHDEITLYTFSPSRTR